MCERVGRHLFLTSASFLQCPPPPSRLFFYIFTSSSSFFPKQQVTRLVLLAHGRPMTGGVFWTQLGIDHFFPSHSYNTVDNRPESESQIMGPFNNKKNPSFLTHPHPDTYADTIFLFLQHKREERNISLSKVEGGHHFVHSSPSLTTFCVSFSLSISFLVGAFWFAWYKAPLTHTRPSVVLNTIL